MREKMAKRKERKEKRKRYLLVACTSSAALNLRIREAGTLMIAWFRLLTCWSDGPFE